MPVPAIARSSACPGRARRRRRPRCWRRTGWCWACKIDDGEMFERLLEEATLPIAPGDLFLLYTDGLTEAMNAAGDFFGEDRLSALVQSHGTGPFHQLRDEILARHLVVRRSGRAAGRHDDAAAARAGHGARRRVSPLGSARRPVVVFHTSSNIEASVVMALLDSHGIDSFRISGNPQAIWPMAVNALGDIQIAVAGPAADDARRIIDSHRQDVGARLVRLRGRLRRARAPRRLPLQGPRPARAGAHAPVARGRGRVAAPPTTSRSSSWATRCWASSSPTGCSTSSPNTTRGRSRRSRRRWCPRSRWRGTPRRSASATTCCSGAARRRPAAGSSRRCWPTPTKR